MNVENQNHRLFNINSGEVKLIAYSVVSFGLIILCHDVMSHGYSLSLERVGSKFEIAPAR